MDEIENRTGEADETDRKHGTAQSRAFDDAERERGIITDEDIARMELALDEIDQAAGRA